LIPTHESVCRVVFLAWAAVAVLETCRIKLVRQGRLGCETADVGDFAIVWAIKTNYPPTQMDIGPMLPAPLGRIQDSELKQCVVKQRESSLGKLETAIVSRTKCVIAP